MDGFGTQPRILVADDDAVSLRFLAAALSELGCAVTAVANGATTLDACAAAQFDLLLLDRRMPDRGGAELLLTLRQRCIQTRAIATSAELTAATRLELQAAGYVEALSKPIGLDALARVLSTHLSGWRDPRTQRPESAHAISRSGADSTLLDDAAGLSSVGGDVATLQALRGLLASELQTLRDRLPTTPRAAELADTLHRLRASCRYCGATALGEAAAHVEAAIRTDAANTRALLTQFLESCDRTLAALSDQPRPNLAR